MAIMVGILGFGGSVRRCFPACSGRAGRRRRWWPRSAARNGRPSCGSVPRVQVASTAAAAKMAHTLVLAVKPQDMGRLLDEIAPVLPGSAW